MTGGAVKLACEAVRDRCSSSRRRSSATASSRWPAARSALTAARVDLAELLGDAPIEETFEHHHRPTSRSTRDGPG